jgi:hypothetical protein
MARLNIRNADIFVKLQTESGTAGTPSVTDGLCGARDRSSATHRRCHRIRVISRRRSRRPPSDSPDSRVSGLESRIASIFFNAAFIFVSNLLQELAMCETLGA